MGGGVSFRERYRVRRFAPRSLWGGIAVAVLLSLSGVSLAAASTGVVPPSGKVAGHGYAYWLQRSDQLTFSSTVPVNPCRTLVTNGVSVGYITLKKLAPGKQKVTCSEPAGRPLYITLLSAECSTLKGDHGTFGTSGSQLRQCARKLMQAVTGTLTVDGHPVDVKKLGTTTKAVAVHIVKNNPVGAPPGRARSASSGPGLLLAGLRTGKHVIHGLASIAGGPTFDVTWTLHIS